MPRSTNLDGWQAEQIKRVLAGGNPAAHDFFKKQGVGADVQGETKYTCRAGQLYRAHLDKLAQCVSPRMLRPLCSSFGILIHPLISLRHLLLPPERSCSRWEARRRRRRRPSPSAA